MSAPDKIDGWVDFETMTTHLDGEDFPVTALLDAKGRATTNPDEAVIYHAGRGDQWFAARIIRREPS